MQNESLGMISLEKLEVHNAPKEYILLGFFIHTLIRRWLHNEILHCPPRVKYAVIWK